MIEDHWRSLRINEDHWRSLRIIEDHWGSLTIIENHRRSLRIIKDYWGSWKIIEDHKIDIVWFQLEQWLGKKRASYLLLLQSWFYLTQIHKFHHLKSALSHLKCNWEIKNINVNFFVFTSLISKSYVRTLFSIIAKKIPNPFAIL